MSGEVYRTEEDSSLPVEVEESEKADEFVNELRAEELYCPKAVSARAIKHNFSAIADMSVQRK